MVGWVLVMLLYSMVEFPLMYLFFLLPTLGFAFSTVNGCAFAATGSTCWAHAGFAGVALDLGVLAGLVCCGLPTYAM